MGGKDMISMSPLRASLSFHPQAYLVFGMSPDFWTGHTYTTIEYAIVTIGPMAASLLQMGYVKRTFTQTQNVSESFIHKLVALENPLVKEDQI